MSDENMSVFEYFKSLINKKWHLKLYDLEVSAVHRLNSGLIAEFANHGPGSTFHIILRNPCDFEKNMHLHATVKVCYFDQALLNQEKTLRVKRFISSFFTDPTSGKVTFCKGSRCKVINDKSDLEEFDTTLETVLILQYRGCARPRSLWCWWLISNSCSELILDVSLYCSFANNEVSNETFSYPCNNCIAALLTMEHFSYPWNNFDFWLLIRDT